MTTNDQRARQLAKKVGETPRGHSSAGGITAVEAIFEEIVRVAGEVLKLKDLRYDRTHPKYARAVGTLDGLVWSYCFAWDNCYEPYFTASRTRVRREAVKIARERITSEMST